MSGRLALLVIWTASVVVVTILGIGFAGGVGEMFTADNWPAWLAVASPVVPLALWLHERRRDGPGRKLVKHKPVEKSE